MKTSHRGIVAIEGREGIRLTVYRDSKGLPTVGVGHLVVPEDGLKVGDKITQEQCDAFLSSDLGKCESAINTCVKTTLAQHEFDALASFILNIGVGNSKKGFKGSQVLRSLNDGDKSAAAEAFMHWVKPKEITGRRRSEQKQFLTPYPNTSAVVSSGQESLDPASPGRNVVPAGGPITGSTEQPSTSVETTIVEKTEDVPPGTSTETRTTINESGSVSVEAAKPSLWTLAVSFGTMLYGYYKVAKEDLGDLVDRATGAIDAHFLLNAATGAGLVILGMWLYNRAQQRAHEKTTELVQAAADKDKNTVHLTTG